MEAVALIVVIFGAMYAVRGGYRGVKGAYTSRRDDWDARPENDGAPWLRRRAAMAGFLLQLLKNGGPALIDGVKAGWREGQALGRAKADSWKAAPQVAKTKVDTTKPAPAVSPPPPGPAGGPTPPPPPGGDANETPPPPPGGDANGTRGVEMPDVTNPETLHAALKAKALRQNREVHDAVEAQKRAEEEVALTEQIVASMQKHNFQKTHVEIVTALIDPEQAAVTACESRVVAASTASAQVDKAVAMAAKHVELQGAGAAGAFYQG